MDRSKGLQEFWEFPEDDEWNNYIKLELSELVSLVFSLNERCVLKSYYVVIIKTFRTKN